MQKNYSFYVIALPFHGNTIQKVLIFVSFFQCVCAQYVVLHENILFAETGGP